MHHLHAGALLKLWLLLFSCIVSCRSDIPMGRNSDVAVAKANIYYQSAAAFGEPTEQLLDRVQTLRSKENFKLIVHGYLASRKHVSIVPLANAYLAQGYENVLVADFKDAANFEYGRSRALISKLAQHFGKILEAFMEKHSIQPAALHIIGHSLGAHVSGLIGDYFNGTVGRVTGLDPAWPLFSPSSVDSLHPNAAQFVDVIHTDSPVLGDPGPRGLVDFYPHFGRAGQPGCEAFDLVSVSKLVFKKYSCSHFRAVILYAESIGLPKSFPTLPCVLAGIQAKNKTDCMNLAKVDKVALRAAIAAGDASGVVYMGEAVSNDARGLYYLETYEVPPYGKGFNTKF